ncbi:membrane-associated proteins in eicosanoid and glutathione metabolism [Delitschia confertaspora ATCC 74209]|uniref:Membrane-associated proteins in eicosanoid and glutathione metabolism n=1 Tax=Delitschia confertaspora ATCC 74209 TaxID=1513339 RepID=A0A9P4JLV1_9PLEO|nr:membrane-associated proteins in eicosanoid and glutathione metabolism [Delitschia confertaspora ATCC 74209]
MVALSIQLPNEYGLVLLAAVSTFGAAIWHGIRVGGYRKAAKVPYPYEYASYEQIQTSPPAASKAMLQFNCAQRAHQNFNENHPTAVGALLIAGLGYPRAAAVMGALWVVNRIVYAVGYTRSEGSAGKGRYYGILWMLAHYGLVGMAGKVAWDFWCQA